MELKDFFDSRWLRADDLNGQDRVVTVEKYTAETIKNKEGLDERRLVLWFTGVRKALILNRTNALAIAKLSGTDKCDGWVGLRLTLTRELVAAFGRTDWGIRIKPAPQPAAPQPVPQASQPMATPWGVADAETVEPF